MRFVLIAIVLFVTPPALAQTTIDLGDLNINPNRVPQWYPFDETDYNAAQTTWAEYDVTCSSAPCASGKDPHTDEAAFSGCSSVTTGALSNITCFRDAAPAETVLYLPAGTYAQTSAITVNRDDIVFRGAGPTTILNRTTVGREAVFGDCDPNTGAISFAVCRGNFIGASTPWTSGYAEGETSVVVDTPGNFSIGGWIRLRMSGAIACEYMDKLLNGGGEADGFNHIDKITNIIGNTIVLERGLRMNYVGTGCTGHEAIQFSPAVNVGIESMRLTSDTSIAVGANGSTQIKYTFVSMVGVVESWVVNVNMDRNYEMWISTYYSSRLWWQGNNFSNLDLGGDTFNTEGIYTTQGAVDNVIENNYCTDSVACAKNDNGLEGQVFSYNYFLQSVLCETGFFNHGHYVRQGLFEGNAVNCKTILNDSFWGRNGDKNTFYRNRNYQSANCFGGVNSFNLDDVGNTGFPAGDQPNFIGNNSPLFLVMPIKENPLCPPSESNTGKSLSSISTNLWIERNVWRIPSGEFNVGTSNGPSCGVFVDDTCPGTNVNQAGPDSGWATETFPTSLYRTEAPSWWCQEACAWDQTGIGAFGDAFCVDRFDDVSDPQTTGDPDGLCDTGKAAIETTICKLPAQIRAEAGTCTALTVNPGGTGITLNDGITLQ